MVGPNVLSPSTQGVSLIRHRKPDCFSRRTAVRDQLCFVSRKHRLADGDALAGVRVDNHRSRLVEAESLAREGLFQDTVVVAVQASMLESVSR